MATLFRQKVDTEEEAVLFATTITVALNARVRASSVTQHGSVKIISKLATPVERIAVIDVWENASSAQSQWVYVVAAWTA